MSSADEKSLPGDADVKLAPLEIDPAVERRVVRKLDMTVLIAFAMVFGINYLDSESPFVRERKPSTI